MSRRERAEVVDRRGFDAPSGRRPQVVDGRHLAEDRLSEALHHTVALPSFLTQGDDVVTLQLRERGNSNENFVHFLLAGDIGDGLSAAEYWQAVNAFSSFGQVVVDEPHRLIRKFRIVAYLPEDHLPRVPGPNDQQSPAAAGQP